MPHDRKLFSLDSLAMYMVTLLSEVPLILARAIIVYLTAAFILLAKGDPHPDPGIWAELGLLPPLWSILALATPIGTGWWWKQRMGGREPSGRERLAYQDAVEHLQAHSPVPLPLPSSWFVTDEIEADAAVCGNTLLLSHGILESEFLPAVLAHELGHLASPDGRLTAAVNRLVLWTPRPKNPEGEPVETGLVFILQAAFWVIGKFLATIRGGGFGLYATGPLWGRYWRGREYKADEYAASLGQADELADFLEIHALIHDHPVPFIWLSEHTHPPAELRIDKLRARTHDAAPDTGLVATA
jgi:Zn-dependent protease with chaperone function